ncbi:hypothetical protein ACFCWV_12095 [Streptomyces sp. NPDC056341]|uniref:hypothetical protein n=1 Tax=Streptomyces sp. NPDC056341 TaxID=3345788 RepID=UPI0035D8EF83
MAHLESADRSVLLALGREPSFAPRIEQDQELVSAEINFCRYWLQHCGLGAWALHLSQHPEDTRLVVSSIQKDQFALIEYELELIAEDSPEDFQKAESARALLPAANDLIEQQPPAPAPAPAGQGAVPGHPYAPPTSGTPYIPQQAPGAPYGPPCTAAGPTPAAPPGFRLPARAGRTWGGPHRSTLDAPPEPAVILGSRAGERLLGGPRPRPWRCPCSRCSSPYSPYRTGSWAPGQPLCSWNRRRAPTP